MSIQKVGLRLFALVRWINRSHKMNRIQPGNMQSRLGEFEMPEMNRIKRPTQQT